jgi:type I restriction enzyme S subunit
VNASATFITLGEAVELINGDRGKNYPDREAQLPDGYCLFLNTKNVRRGYFDFSDVVFITKDRHESLGGGTLRRNDIVLTIRGTLGNTAIYSDDVPYDVVRINSAMLIIRPKSLFDPNFVERFLRSSGFMDWVGLNQRGSAQPHLRTVDIETAQLPLVTKNRQRRIVAKIDSLSAKSRRARDQLARVPRLVEKYRQAILAAAFQGLDESGRVALGDLSSVVTSGSRGWAKYYSAEGARFIRVGNVQRLNARLDWSDTQRVIPPEGAEGQRTLVKPNDLVVTITADLGRVGLILADIGAAYVNQHVALVRLKSPDCAPFIAWYLASDIGQAQLLERNRGATRAGLGLDDVRAVRVPVAAPAIQAAVVKRIESAFEWIAQLAWEANRAGILMDHLDRAVLAKAFRGELV